MGGHESPFGREFDSLADIVSFGAAPAFLVHRIVLKGVFVSLPQLGWFIASVYLICGAFRLARFNCLAAMNSHSSSKEFLGFPIPAAAGLVASLTLFLLWLEEKGFSKSNLRFALPVLLVFLSCMMVSEVKYPSFKSLHFRTRGSLIKVLIIALSVGFFLILWERVLPVLAPVVFTIYLLYGFVRPFISRALRREIEDEEEDETDEAK
jgi:CDP-diacylglycerol--serine O-phosphatidyltransferase